MNVARLRNVDGYENMSRQQLENIFTMLSTSTPTPILISRPRPRPKTAIRFPTNPTPKARRTPESPLIEKDGLGKMKMAKTRSISKNTWYQWYGSVKTVANKNLWGL